MTFKEKLAREYPKNINENCVGGCDACPCIYGYESPEESKKNCAYIGGQGCEYCWNREIATDGKRIDKPKKYNDITVKELAEKMTELAKQYPNARIALPDTKKGNRRFLSECIVWEDKDIVAITFNKYKDKDNE